MEAMKHIFEYLFSKKSDLDKIKTKKYKDFKDVKIGDLGIDYNGTSVTILKKGTAKELEKYDDFGSFSEDIEHGFIEEDEDAVLVTFDHRNVVFIYGPEGVVVLNKKN